MKYAGGYPVRSTIGRGLPLTGGEPTTLAELFLQAVATYDRSDALNFKRDGKWHSISSEEMVRRARSIALGLSALGLRAGDRVAILSTNSPEWTLADAGCQFSGIIDVPIYTTMAPESVGYILRDSDARLAFLENRDVYDRIAPILQECLSIERLVFFDGEGIDLKTAISLADLERPSGGDGTAAPPDGPNADIQPNDVATLIYTSGTTGEPKGVMLTHANIISNVIDAGEKYAFSSDDVPLSVLPLSHIFERSAMYLYILNGMAVHYAESIAKVPDNLLEVRPTIFVGVPRIFEKVYAAAKLRAAESGGLKEKIFDWAMGIAKDFTLEVDSAKLVSSVINIKHRIADRIIFSKLRKFFGGRLRFCITGGAALSDEIFLMFTGAGIAIMQGYGLTETSPVISSNNPKEVKLGSVGKPIRNMSVRIAKDGEVEVAGPGVMLGYYNRSEANEESFADDGWFKTGDIGRLDKDGFLFITDRKKELFKTSGGKYIAPSPIEQMICSSRFVNQAVLVGNGRKFASALIVPNFEHLASYARLKGLALTTPKEFCQDRSIVDLIERQVAEATSKLARYETVKKIVLLENEMTVESEELTPTLKIKRRVIGEKYKDLIDKIYSDSEIAPTRIKMA